MVVVESDETRAALHRLAYLVGGLPPQCASTTTWLYPATKDDVLLALACLPAEGRSLANATRPTLYITIGPRVQIAIYLPHDAFTTPPEPSIADLVPEIAAALGLPAEGAA